MDKIFFLITIHCQGKFIFSWCDMLIRCLAYLPQQIININSNAVKHRLEESHNTDFVSPK